MELEVGMYVRTEYGISKIVNIFFEKTGTFIETDNGLGNCNMSTRGKLYKGIYILEEDYKTFIDNNVKKTIIDLIEEDDFVNEYLVTKIKEDEDGKYLVTITNSIIRENDIETILTHEQFEAMAYRIEE